MKTVSWWDFLRVHSDLVPNRLRQFIRRTVADIVTIKIHENHSCETNGNANHCFVRLTWIFQLLRLNSVMMETKIEI